MPRRFKPPLVDLTVKAKDCYAPDDYVLVHKDYLARLVGAPTPEPAPLALDGEPPAA